MVEVLHNEDNKLLDYQQKRNLTNQDILERELESSRQLKDFFCDYERNRSDIIQKICEDEELQKEAVATLIGMNDARTWGLVEQLKIVEAQLANMTQIEIDKKTFSSIDQMVNIQYFFTVFSIFCIETREPIFSIFGSHLNYRSLGNHCRFFFGFSESA